jgi:hypothetical protein
MLSYAASTKARPSKSPHVALPVVDAQADADQQPPALTLQGSAAALLLPLVSKPSAPLGKEKDSERDAPRRRARRGAGAAGGTGGAPRWLAALYVLLNIASTCGIVFANKLVLSTFGFAYPVALTLVHALFTALGMELMCRTGLFARKAAPARHTLPVALAYVGSIVFSNMSISFNTVRMRGANAAGV